MAVTSNLKRITDLYFIEGKRISKVEWIGNGITRCADGGQYESVLIIFDDGTYIVFDAVLDIIGGKSFVTSYTPIELNAREGLWKLDARDDK